MARYQSVDELLGHEGKELGTTDWHLIDQKQVDQFADVTDDHQWIHVDPERARAEGPYGGTIVHGALTLSLCTAFLSELIHVSNVTHVINVGFDRVRFRAPVPVGSRLRGTATLVGSRRMGEGARVTVRITAEIEGESKPACVADQVLMFNV